MSPRVRAGGGAPKSNDICACCSAYESPDTVDGSNSMGAFGSATGGFGAVSSNSGRGTPAAVAASSSALPTSARCCVARRGLAYAPIPPPRSPPANPPSAADCATPAVMSFPVNAFRIACSAPDWIDSSVLSLASPPIAPRTTVCPIAVFGAACPSSRAATAPSSPAAPVSLATAVVMAPVASPAPIPANCPCVSVIPASRAALMTSTSAAPPACSPAARAAPVVAYFAATAGAALRIANCAPAPAGRRDGKLDTARSCKSLGSVTYSDSPGPTPCSNAAAPRAFAACVGPDFHPSSIWLVSAKF